MDEVDRAIDRLRIRVRSRRNMTRVVPLVERLLSVHLPDVLADTSVAEFDGPA
jgi:hypothetical protein